MVLQAKPGTAIWNKDLLDMNTFVPVMLGSFFFLSSWRESEEVLMFEGKTCFFKPFLAFCFASMGGIQGVTTPIAFRICCTSHILGIPVMPHVIIFFPCTIYLWD